jgi:signal transduction histidine kinase
MKFLVTTAAIFMVGTLAVAQTADRPKAISLVKEGIALAKASGKDALLKEVNFGSGKFHVGPGRPLYLFVYDGAGKCLAQGSTSTFVGSNRIGVKDPDGKPYIAEIIKLGKSAGKGWVDYKFLNPANGKVEPKTTYLEAFEDLVVCCGIYK